MARITHDHRVMHRNVSWKTPVRAATTASVTIATALNNGDTLDGVTLATGDRVLVKDQATGSQNGIYVVAASPARADDFVAQGDVLGMVVIVSEGTTNADTAWLCTTNAPITIGTTTLVFTAFGTGGGGGATITVEQTGGSPSTGSVDTIEVGDYTDLGGGVVVLLPEISGVGVDDQLTFSGSNATLYAPDFDALIRIFNGSGILYQGRAGAGDFNAAGHTFNVGANDLTLYLGEKDTGTIQAYSDQDVELTDQTFSGNTWKTRGRDTFNLNDVNRGLARRTSAVAIANTETVVASYSMPADMMVAGTTFRIRAYGRLTSGATGGSSIFRCRIGTTTLTGNIPASLTIANAALVTNAPFVLDMLVTVRTAGATGTAIGNVSVNGGVIGAFTAVADVSAISATVVVDTTATKLIELTYISGNAGTTATFENAVIEVAYA